jgi:CubicO group peptidase (beta-lactamase class C family)
MKKTSFILLILWLLIISCSENNRISKNIIPSDRFENIKDSISKKIDNGDIPSLSVAVIENGEIIWMESFGYADKENRIKATPNTLYGIASISKPVTATGIMKLVEDGKIDLDADIETYLSNTKLKYYTSDNNRVNCRNLLSHTAGLPLHFQYYYGDDTHSIPDINQVTDQYGIVVNSPSTKYDYANLGYGILGEIIVETTGKSFNDYMIEDIFTPLGMTQTSLDISSETQNKLAKRYDFKGNLMPFSFCDTPGAGNVSSTIYDLIQFGKFHLGNDSENKTSLMRMKTIKSMQHGQYTDNSNGRNTYGLGWFFDDKQYKYKMVFHAGGMDGVDAMMRLVPEKNIVVAALSNQYSEYTHEITEQILLEMIPDLKSVETKQAQKQQAATQEELKEIKQSDLNGKWKGHIITNDNQIPIELVFQEDGDIQIIMPIQFGSMLLRTNIYQIQHKMLVNKWFFNDGHLMGWYAGDIPGEHLLRCPQTTLLNLKYKNGKLIGTASALASHSSWMHYALSYYLELEKEGNK